MDLLIPILAQAEAATASDLPKLLTILVGAVGLLLVMIIWMRMQAFVALILISVLVAIAAGFPLTEIAGTIEKGMGSSLGFIAVIIGMGAIFGQMLEHSGGAQRLAQSLLKFFGEKRASWAMLVTGFIISIPVFFDVGLVIVSSILFSLTKKSGKSLLVFGLPLVAAMATTHAFVPPTPGPAYVAYNLGVDLGTMIIWGILVGLPTAIVAAIVGRKMGEKFYVPVPVALDTGEEKPEAELPGFGLVALIIALPILLILAGTGVERFMVAKDIPAGLSLGDYNSQLAEALAASAMPVQLIAFLGKPIIALLIATLAALYFLGTMRKVGAEALLELSTKALGPAGIIILITGAGGVFKQVLIATGIADALKEAFGDSLPLVVIAFLLALVVRVAQGSATVAMVTTAALVSSFAADGDYSSSYMALVVIAIAAGSTALSHVNDSGFWIVNRYFGMTVKDTLKTWTVVTCVIAGVGFGLAFMLSFFV